MDKKKKLLWMLAYVGFCLIVIEAGARTAFGVPQIATALFADEDYSWRRSWIKRRRLLGREVYYTFDRFDATKGWLPKPGLSDVRAFGNYLLNTNSKALRGRREFSYEPDGQRVRILVLGDSFVFGDEVNDDQTFPHYLQELLPQTEVINLGVHGYGHDQMLLYLREEGVKYRPDIVILGFLAADMPRNLLTFRDFAKPRFVLADGGLHLTGYPLPRPEEVMERDWLRPRTVDLLALLRFRLKNWTGLYEAEMHAVTTALLNEIVNESQAAGAVPVFAYLPLGYEIFSEVESTAGEQFLATACKSIENVSCFSTRPHFIAQSRRGVRFKLEGHWWPTGHYAAAEAVRDYLRENKLVP